MEQKEKFMDKCKRWKNEPIQIVKDFNFLNIARVVVATVLFLVTIIGGYNFMTEVNMVLSSFVALSLFIQIVKHNKLNLYVIAEYGIMVFGVAFTFIVRGADSFWYRFGYNFGLSLLAIICITLLACIPKFKNHKASYYVTRATSFVMIGASLIYFLFMNIRLKPTCYSLQAGHDDYLNKVKTNSTNEDDPNVLVILMDDMAFSDISSYSYMEDNPTIKTPNIDSIGESGIRMDNCYTSAPVSSPSRFSILTGRYSCRGYLDNVVFNTKQQNIPFSQTRFFNPFQLGHNADGILGDEITVAEAMKADGYTTGLFGKWNLGDYGEYLPTNQGFDYFYGSHYINDMIPYNCVEERNGEFKEVYTHQQMVDQSMSTTRFTGKLMEYMEETVNNKDKFFLEYWSPWPHFPIYSNNNGNGIGDHSDDNYVDCIEEFDRSVGEILDYLKNTDDPRHPGEKLYENTLIMFTSDNGPGREGVTGNLRGRKNTPFEGAYKVPFLASYPKGFDHRDEALQSRCINMDVFATILDFAHIELPTDRAIDGVSMKDLWKGVDKDGNVVAQDKNLHDRIYYFKTGSAKAIAGEFDAYSYVEAEDDIYMLNGEVVSKDTAGAKLIVRKGQAIQELDDLGNPIVKKQDFKYYENVQTENAAFFNQFYKDYLFNLDADPAEGYNIAMREDISTTPMSDADRKAKKPLNPIAKQLKQELQEFNKAIKNDKYRRTHEFK